MKTAVRKVENGAYILTVSLFLMVIWLFAAVAHGEESSTNIIQQISNEFSSIAENANPAVVLVSIVSKDESLDSRYSSDAVRGISANGQNYKCITTRSTGHIHLSISPPQAIFGKGERTWHNL